MDDIYTLIALYLNGEADKGQKEQLLKWMSESDENSRLYNELAEVWRMSDAKVETVQPNEEEMWHRIAGETGIHLSTTNMKLDNDSSFKLDPPPKSYSQRMFLRWISLAAVVALLMGVGLGSFMGWLSSESLSETVLIAAQGEKSQAVLPDGTKVWLNSGSRLAYSSDFSARNRKVRLKGEAFFDVKTTKNKDKFLVQTKDVEVVVHGTAFDVCAFSHEPTSVLLSRGSVEVLSAVNHQRFTFLKPGQRATIQGENCQVSKFDPEINNVWIEGKMVFKMATIDEVFAKMRRWYGVNITVLNAPEDVHYWFAIQTESLTEMLSLINKITPIDFDLKGEEVTVSYR